MMHNPLADLSSPVIGPAQIKNNNICIYNDKKILQYLGQQFPLSLAFIAYQGGDFHFSVFNILKTSLLFIQQMFYIIYLDNDILQLYHPGLQHGDEDEGVDEGPNDGPDDQPKTQEVNTLQTNMKS